MKDLLGNPLAVRDRVAVELPSSRIMGFIAEVHEPSVQLALRKGVEQRPGYILVSCVISLPVDPKFDAVAQVVKVYDPNAQQGAVGASDTSQGTSDADKPN